MRWNGILAATIVALLAAASPAAADTFVVNTTADDAGCLRHEPARSGRRSSRPAETPGPDTIQIPAGTYQLTQGPLQITSAVTISGASARDARRSTPRRARACSRSPATTASISHLTVSGGVATANAGFHGGNIRAQSSTVLLDHMRVMDGSASSGGGIANRNGTMTIQNSLIDHNHADQGGGDGGGIINFGGDGGSRGPAVDPRLDDRVQHRAPDRRDHPVRQRPGLDHARERDAGVQPAPAIAAAGANFALGGPGTASIRQLASLACAQRRESGPAPNCSGLRRHDQRRRQRRSTTTDAAAVRHAARRTTSAAPARDRPDRACVRPGRLSPGAGRPTSIPFLRPTSTRAATSGGDLLARPTRPATPAVARTRGAATALRVHAGADDATSRDVHDRRRRARRRRPSRTSSSSAPRRAPRSSARSTTRRSRPAARRTAPRASGPATTRSRSARSTPPATAARRHARRSPWPRSSRSRRRCRPRRRRPHRPPKPVRNKSVEVEHRGHGPDQGQDRQVRPAPGRGRAPERVGDRRQARRGHDHHVHGRAGHVLRRPLQGQPDRRAHDRHPERAARLQEGQARQRAPRPPRSRRPASCGATARASSGPRAATARPPSAARSGSCRTRARRRSRGSRRAWSACATRRSNKTVTLRKGKSYVARAKKKK